MAVMLTPLAEILCEPGGGFSLSPEPTGLPVPAGSGSSGWQIDSLDWWFLFPGEVFPTICLVLCCYSFICFFIHQLDTLSVNIVCKSFLKVCLTVLYSINTISLLVLGAWQWHGYHSPKLPGQDNLQTDVCISSFKCFTGNDIFCIQMFQGTWLWIDRASFSYTNWASTNSVSSNQCLQMHSSSKFAFLIYLTDSSILKLGL